MPDMTKLFADLQAALDTLAKAETVRDKAVAAANVAANAYTDALNKAVAARSALQSAIGDVLPNTEGGRVRQG